MIFQIATKRAYRKFLEEKTAAKKAIKDYYLAKKRRLDMSEPPAHPCEKPDGNSPDQVASVIVPLGSTSNGLSSGPANVVELDIVYVDGKPYSQSTKDGEIVMTPITFV